MIYSLATERIIHLNTPYQLRNIIAPRVNVRYFVMSNLSYYRYDSADTSTADDNNNTFVVYDTNYRIKKII